MKTLTEIAVQLPTQLTDYQREALSYAYHGKHPESHYDEFETGPHYRAMDDAPAEVVAQVSRLTEANMALSALGLLESYHLTRVKRRVMAEESPTGSDHWEHAEYEHVYAPRTYAEGEEIPDPDQWWLLRYADGHTTQYDGWGGLQAITDAGWKYDGWGYGAGWNYRLTDLGRETLEALHPYLHKCCDGCVQLPCVCAVKTYCAIHGGGCHGTHD